MHGNVDFISECFPQTCTGFCCIAKFSAVQGRGEGAVSSSTEAMATPSSTPRRTESEFERRESFTRRFRLICPRLALRFIKHVRWTAMRVNRNVLPDQSAEQAIDGRTR
jgi:hypothetical protein